MDICNHYFVRDFGTYMELLFISSVGGDLTIPIRSLMAEIKVTINIAHPKLIPINTINLNDVILLSPSATRNASRASPPTVMKGNR
jgi:hypothetical protein